MSNYSNKDKIGNEFWKLRVTSGRKKLFTSPKVLLNCVNEYFEWCNDHPYLKQEQRKGNVIIPKDNNLSPKEFKDALNPVVSIPTMRPLSINNLCLFLGVAKSWFVMFENGIKDKVEKYESETGKGRDDKKDKEYIINLDFLNVIAYIRQTIEGNQLDGGLIGAYNPMIITRLLGLQEKTDITTNGNDISISNIIFAKESD